MPRVGILYFWTEKSHNRGSQRRFLLPMAAARTMDILPLKKKLFIERLPSKDFRDQPKFLILPNGQRCDERTASIRNAVASMTKQP